MNMHLFIGFPSEFKSISSEKKKKSFWFWFFFFFNWFRVSAGPVNAGLETAGCWCGFGVGREDHVLRVLLVPLPALRLPGG